MNIIFCDEQYFLSLRSSYGEKIKGEVDDLMGFLNKNIEAKSKLKHDFCFYNVDGKIVGFIDIIYEQASSHATLFAVFVEESHRNRGIAKALIHETYNRSITSGINTFTISIGQPFNQEKSALFSVFKALAEAKSGESKFTIHYQNETFIYT